MFIGPKDDQERGSVAILMTVMLVAIGLTSALVVTVHQNLKVSRRAGDSANALQVADAGVNDAIKAVKNAAGVVGTCPAYPTLPGFTRTGGVGSSGTYTYCAAQDTAAGGLPVWHIDATGVDATGVKRRVRADAKPESLFGNAIVVLASAEFDSGFTVDSFLNETSTCTGKGLVGTNDPNNFTFRNHGKGVGVTNCGGLYPPDGCIAYSPDGSVPIPATEIGPGGCPPAGVYKKAPLFFAPGVTPPTSPDFGTGSGNFTCSGALTPGKTYYYNTVTLANGCRNPDAATPVNIYAASSVTIGSNGATVNRPPTGASAFCGPTHPTNTDYCPGWSGGLRVNVIGSGGVTFAGNHGSFWGVVNAPSSASSWGGPQWEIWGSLITTGISGQDVQCKFHYDENLGAINNGKYVGSIWREEPLP